MPTRRQLEKVKIRISPVVGLGESGDDDVRFALTENESHIRQTMRGIKAMLRGEAAG